VGLPSSRCYLVATLALFVANGCGDDGSTVLPDAGDDGGGDAGSLEIEAPAAPMLTPCASGFREVLLEELDVVVCEPWPPGGRESCGPYEAHFPGEPGCVPIGVACPSAGRFATDLPAGVVVYHVDPEAPAGGDGSLAAPFDTLSLAMRDAGSGDVIALAPGTYDEAPRLRPGVSLWGACPAETLLSPTTTMGSLGAVSSNGEVTVKNLSITGVRFGAAALDVKEHVILEGVWIEGAANYDVIAANGGRVTVRGSHLGTPAFVPGLNQQHVLSQTGGRVDLERVEIVGAVFAAVTSEEVGSVASLDHVVIRDSLGMPGTGNAGRGVGVQYSGRAEVRASVIEDVSEIGVIARGAGCEVLVEDSVIRRVSAQGDGLFGRGFSTQDDASGRIARVFIEETVESALLSLAAAPLEIEDVVIRRVAPSPLGDFYGLGVAVTNSDFTIRRAIIAQTQTGAINIQGALTASIFDARVMDTEGEVAEGRFGRGLNAFLGAAVTVERLAISRVRDVGIFLTGASATMTDVRVEGVEEQRCAETTCSERPNGIGIGAYDEATVTIERFSVATSALAGIQVAGGDLLLSVGEVADNPIGANVQDPDFDLDRITAGVRYRDNGTNLDAERLPVPEIPELPDG